MGEVVKTKISIAVTSKMRVRLEVPSGVVNHAKLIAFTLSCLLVTSILVRFGSRGGMSIDADLDEHVRSVTHVTASPAAKEAVSPPSDGEDGWYDLDRIRDPIRDLDISNAPSGDDAAVFTQIHHGIYKVSLRLPKLSGSGSAPLTFAFKTECRPASKWHGQQGWSEVGVFHFTSMFTHNPRAANHSDTFASISPPRARGVLLRINARQLDSVVHRDHCGLLSDVEFGALAEFQGSAGASATEPLLPLPPGRHMLMGVALTWQPRHDDNALPGRSLLPLLRPPTPAPGATDAAHLFLNPTLKEQLSQLSDVSLMDYILSNEDREEKNWFYDAHRRYVMMDNGWAFAGRKYEGSVCSTETALLKCPPIFRHIDSASCSEAVNCRFRRETYDQLVAFRQWWDREGIVAWQQLMLQDPLVAVLLLGHGEQNTAKRNGKLLFNNGLARYVHRCNGTWAGYYHAAPRRVAAASAVQWVAQGLSRRMEQLQQHVETCLQQYGTKYTFMTP